MNKFVLMSVFLALSFVLCAQSNLVLNPGFESGTHNKRGTYVVKKEQQLINDWHTPNRRSVLFFVEPEKSVAVANNGSNSVGLSLGSGRQEKTKFEYITGKFSTPLKKGQVYCICFNTLLHRSSSWAGTDLGIIVHQDKDLLSDIDDPTTLSADLYINDRAPVTNTKWKQYCGYYIASGGEEYISFGKFGKSESVLMKDLDFKPYSDISELQVNAFYQLDDFSVVPLNDSTDCGCAENITEMEETHESKPLLQPYLFALDASGSMKKNALFDSLRQNLKRLLMELPEGTFVSFVTFSSSSRAIFSGEINASTPDLVDSLLAQSPVGGGTNVLKGLQLAYESRQTSVPDSAKMVLISDGVFNVSSKMVDLVKYQYETQKRRLTIIQIGAKASGVAELHPYLDDYIRTTPKELNTVVSGLYVKKNAENIAYGCECVEAYSDTVNYHFVIDYSGSMRLEKGRAISAMKYLFEKTPENAMISVTTFDVDAQELYVGRKSDITISELSQMLRAEKTGGGTDPVPGVKNALRLAEKMTEGHFSHIILITDLKPTELSRLSDLSRSMQNSIRNIDLAGCAITVDAGGLVAMHSQFDETTGNFLNVGQIKFERDLFYTKRSSCDYTSQAYHYNPLKDFMKTEAKRVVRKELIKIIKGSMSP